MASRSCPRTKSSHQEANRRRLEAFFAGPIALLPFEEEDAKVSGAVRAALEADGKPIGAYDLLIAGQVSRNKFTLVTSPGRIGASRKLYPTTSKKALAAWLKPRRVG
jgi:predicted nucleic acid-binding protein